MSVKWIDKDAALIIKADGITVGAQEAREYLTLLKANTQHYRYLIFDFSEVTDITAAALRTLSFSASLANQIGAKLAVVGTTTTNQCIKSSGLEKIFPYYSSIEQIFQVCPPPSLLRQDLSESLADAVKTTFLTITGNEAHQLLSKDSEKQDYSKNFQIGAIVGILGKSFKGSLILGFSDATFLNLVSKMFEATYSEITNEISDGPAEVLNMIFGHLKVALNEKGFGVSQAIPTTIRGSNLRIVPTSSSESSPIVLVFQTESGVFYVELNSNCQSLQSAA